jgi:hypothetical protein
MRMSGNTLQPLMASCNRVPAHPGQERVDVTKEQSYFVSVKTVNLTIDERTWRAARALAAERDTSVSGLVREALSYLTRTDERREKARKEILQMIGTFDAKVGRMPSREARNARC